MPGDTTAIKTMQRKATAPPQWLVTSLQPFYQGGTNVIIYLIMSGMLAYCGDVPHVQREVDRGKKKKRKMEKDGGR